MLAKLLTMFSVFILFWLLLVDGEFNSLVVGGIFVLIATLTSYWLSDKTGRSENKHSIHILRLPRFIGFFFYQSLLGGVDTAFRACKFPLDISPRFIHYPLIHLPSGTPVSFFMTTVSLLPGSVSVIRETNGVLIHALTTEKSTIRQLKECEQEIAKLFGIDTSFSANPAEKEAL